jgi:transposase-like protein
MTRRKFSQEFKLEAAKEAGGSIPAEAARNHSVKKLSYGWRLPLSTSQQGIGLPVRNAYAPPLHDVVARGRHVRICAP